MKSSIGWVNVYVTEDKQLIISSYPKQSHEESVESRTENPKNKLLGSYEIFSDAEIGEATQPFWAGYRKGYVKGMFYGVVATFMIICLVTVVSLGIPIYP